MTFKSGKSGNPRGKKPGTKNKRLELFRSHDEQLQRKVLDMALAGDISALKIVADRLWPRLRAQAEFVEIDIESDDIAEQGRAIIDAALHGKITVDVGRKLLAAFFAQAKIVEAAEFEARLNKLEEHRDIAPWEIEHRPTRLLTDQKLPMRGKRRRKLN